MVRNTKRKLAIFAGTSKCLIYAEAKYCASEMPGETKYYECSRTEYCCGIGCCVSPGLHFHHLWYYWILVIIMFLVCSGGGWWYRYWLQGRYRAAASAIPTRTTNARAQSSLRGSTCQGQRARITYNSARNTVLLHRMWKGPQRNGAMPAYTGNATTSGHYQNMSVMLNDANCPYYQLYGPPPSYETVIAQTRGKISNATSPESTSARSSSFVAPANSNVSQCFSYTCNFSTRLNNSLDENTQYSSGGTSSRQLDGREGIPFAHFPPYCAVADGSTRQNVCIPFAYQEQPFVSRDTFNPLYQASSIHCVPYPMDKSSDTSDPENQSCQVSNAERYAMVNVDCTAGSSREQGIWQSDDRSTCKVRGSQVNRDTDDSMEKNLGEQRENTSMMMMYKQAEFEDEDSSSIGSVALNSEGISTSATHIRYNSGISLWRARSLLERCLFIICVGLLFMVVMLSIIISSKNGWEEAQILRVTSHEEDGTHCLTEHCVTVAASIINSIDHSVDPCNDFYEYACGGWIKKNPIPDGNSMWGTFDKFEQDNQLVVKNVLEKPFAEMKSKAEKKAKYYFLSCMDANDTIESLGAKPMLDLLDSIGGWNISGKFNLSEWSLQNSMHILQNVYNMDGLFTWAVNEDDRNSSRHIIQIDQGGLTLPTADDYLNVTEHSKVLAAYLEYMTKIGVLLGGETNSTRKQMNDVIKFETELARIMTPPEDHRDKEKLYNLMSLDELQNNASFMSWVDYFQNATQLVNKKVTGQTKIVNFAPEYFVKLSKLVLEYNKTNDGKVILNNYLVWQTVRSLTACLSRPFRDAYKGLRKALIGSEGREEQWRYCVSDTHNSMGFAIGAMFVREVFHGKSKPMAEKMIDQVRKAFIKNLKNLDWMDAETRRKAEEKANAITDMVGFPDFILHPNELDERYKDLVVKQNEYFQNNIRVNKYNLRKNLEKLDRPVNKTTWIMTPPTVNAYYWPTKNQMVFPAGILQSPFYDMENPNSLNFGGIGVVMGHELTHAFDDQGREYDLHGNLHQWWNNATIERFKNRTECFVEQYSNFEIHGRHVNGRQTLGENIADNGGLKAAYHAYLSTPRSYKDQLPLPGLNLTHRQLFFVNFAQVWCSSVMSEAIALQIEKDSHCPPKYRVIGSLSNLPEFASEFNCPEESRMNPIHKCEVW